MTIHLGSSLLRSSRDRPGRRFGKYLFIKGLMNYRPYLVLLPVGFTVPIPLLVSRCALTAPFHPDPEPTKVVSGRFAFCGTVPRVAPAGRYPAPFFRGARTFLSKIV